LDFCNKDLLVPKDLAAPVVADYISKLRPVAQLQFDYLLPEDQPVRPVFPDGLPPFLEIADEYGSKFFCFLLCKVQALLNVLTHLVPDPVIPVIVIGRILLPKDRKAETGNEQ
jgi:hypothetical protein